MTDVDWMMLFVWVSIAFALFAQVTVEGVCRLVEWRRK